MSFDKRSTPMDGGAATAAGSSAADIQAVTLCQTGCGFYANSAFEGMCSKCYKDKLLIQQQLPAAQQLVSAAAGPRSSSPTAAATSPSSLAATSGTETDCQAARHESSCDTDATSQLSENLDVTASHSVAENVTPACLETGSPTVATFNKDKTSSSLHSTDDAESPSSSCSSAEASSGKEKPKRNRCLTCKKKVGLTGFECRCGGLFCSVHRYSDMHACGFNYKELGQAQIRKNNPVVVGEKVHKI